MSSVKMRSESVETLHCLIYYLSRILKLLYLYRLLKLRLSVSISDSNKANCKESLSEQIAFMLICYFYMLVCWFNEYIFAKLLDCISYAIRRCSIIITEACNSVKNWLNLKMLLLNYFNKVISCIWFIVWIIGI